MPPAGRPCLPPARPPHSQRSGPLRVLQSLHLPIRRCMTPALSLTSSHQSCSRYAGSGGRGPGHVNGELPVASSVYMRCAAPAACSSSLPASAARPVVHANPPPSLSHPLSRSHCFRASCCGWTSKRHPPSLPARLWWIRGGRAARPRTAPCAWCVECRTYGLRNAVGWVRVGWGRCPALAARPLGPICGPGAPTSCARVAAIQPQEMDVPRFWDLVMAAMHAADRVSPLNSGSGSAAGGAGGS